MHYLTGLINDKRILVHIGTTDINLYVIYFAISGL